MKFIRHIHNIGQGAFYTEKFYDDENNVISIIVYDCGCENNIKKRATQLIQNTFNTDDNIDILFISHFDADHVNGIMTLKKSVSKISYVILPELNEEEKIILIAKSKAEKENQQVQLLIGNPEAFFNEGKADDQKTKIIYVKKINEEEDINLVNRKDINNERKELYQFNNQDTIKSGTTLIPNRKDWLYIPINLPIADKKIKILKKEMTDRGISIEQLKNSKSGNIINQFKECYKKAFGDLNTYSLVVYSGAANTDRKLTHMSGCLYTGDANLNRERFTETIRGMINKNYLNNIGLIQIPHHGSLLSYNAKVLKEIGENCNYFFLSHGLENAYGHPAQLIIEDMILNNKILMCVNECPNSTLHCFFETHRTRHCPK